MSLEQIIDQLKQYYDTRKEVSFGYLFGSYAQNIYNSRSDLDIAIYLSNYDTESAFEYKFREMTALQEIFRKPIDLILMNEAPPLLKHEIFKNGIIFTEQEHLILVEYRVRSYYQYLDQLYIINRYFAKNKAKIEGRMINGKQQYCEKKDQCHST